MRRLIMFTFSLLCISVSNAQWTELMTGTSGNLYSVSAVNDNVVWVSGEAGIIVMTKNGGTTWNSRGGGGVIGSAELYNIFGIDSMKALVTGSGAAANIYRTTDGGATWTNVFTQTGGFGDGIWMFDSLRGVFYGDPVGGKWSIWRTTDGGATWDSTGTVAPSPGGAAGWSNAIWGNDRSVAIGTSGTQILYSSDYGKTWVSYATPGQSDSYSVYFSDSTTGLVGGTSILRTTNSGTAWQAITTPGVGNVIGIDGKGDTLWMARGGTTSAADSGVYQSTDKGITWTRAYTATNGGGNNQLTFARNGNSVWVATSNGTVVKGFLGGAVGVNDPEVTPNQFSLDQNYPNPFNPTTTIKYQVQSPGFVSLKVYDLLGREVATLVNENKVAGSYTINFSALNLPSGVYMYRLNSGNFTDVKKMTLIK